MAKLDYSKALKMGEKASKAAAARGESPCLPALDDFLRTSEVLDEVNLGVMEIPLDQIVGTKTAGRRSAFAPNFMPLMDERSEFATKWVNLIDYQLEEGVKDPIVAYEFMNRYYVLEGNKRVSVFKYLNAFSIEGEVRRIIPKRTSDPEVKIFYEYMTFYRHTQINYLRFTREGSFAKLTEAVGIGPEDDWTLEQREDFSSAYLKFSKAFEEKGGKKLDITPADAFLIYLGVFPYSEIADKTDTQMKDEVTKIWSEFPVLQVSPEQTLLLEPQDDTAETSLFTRFLKLTGEKYLNVAFIYEYGVEESGWSYSHDLGRMHLEDVFGDRIHTSTYSLMGRPADLLRVIDAAVEDGSHIIFTTSETMLNDTLKAAVKYPDIKFLNCCVHRPHSLLRTYYGRMYEAKFLEGMIAGAMSDNDRIAYAADYPIYGAIACINAFSLGAAMTNPRARIFLHWNCVDDSSLDELVQNNDISIISGVDAMRPGAKNRRYGLYERRKDFFRNLAVPIWNWGRFYEKILRDILSGSWKKAQTESRPALSYWWGISGGIIDLIPSRHLPDGLLNLVLVFRDLFINDNMHPFRGQIRSQDGTLHGEPDTYFSQEAVITMDWLCDNIVGSIPTIDQINEHAREIVNTAGTIPKPVKEEQYEDSGDC